MKIITRRGQLNKEYHKTSDAGFSLIELLIAVTILSIIVIPLLHMFVTSTRINVKSRQTLRATTVAQDIMEGLKAYTLEEVSVQFAPPEGVSGDTFYYPTEGFYILDSSLIQGGVRDLTEDMDGHVEGDEIYYFGIENLKIQGGEYDALIKLDASTYGADSKKVEIKDDGSVDIGNPGGAHDREFNGKFYAEIGSVAETNGGGDEEMTKTDSSYHESKELAEAVIADVKDSVAKQIIAPDAYGNPNGTLPDDWDDLWKDVKLEDIVDKRTIDVELQDGGNGQCKATINFVYECSYTFDGNKYTCTSNGRDGTTAGVVANIPRTFSSGNFYLFYYPIYKSGKVVDNIQFRLVDAAKLCDEQEPLLKSIILAKQIRSDIDVDAGIIAPDLTDAQLRTMESAYRAKVGITADATPKGRLIFKSNVETNMIKNPVTGKWDSIDGIEYSHDTHLMSQIDECDFTGDDASDKVTNIIYDIEITVYQTGAAKHFTESDFEDNDEVHRLASITNINN